MPESNIIRHSEIVPRTGMIDGDAARRALGKPDLSFWEVFLRESVQNSWDARTSEAIDFAISAVELDSDAVGSLIDEIFRDSLPAAVDDLGSWLRSGTCTALVVRDGGTRGLGGPARSDVAVPNGQRTDFRNFVFDIGRDQRRLLGGGTYGFGKGVLYDASVVRTCIIYTRTEMDGALVDRLIAARVGSGFEHAGRRLTGRHWWGAPDDGSVLPVEGDEALRLASGLGMTTPDGRTGTVIAVLGPVDPTAPEDTDLQHAMGLIRDAALKWAWPHLADPSGEPSIRFEFMVNGEAIPINIEDDRQIQQFAAAYREALRFKADRTVAAPFQIEIQRLPLDSSRRETGVLAVRRALQASAIEKTLNNTVALMREPRFVVKYERIDPDPHEQYTAGVFIVDRSMDQVFAKAEPVTHDSWARERGRPREKPIGWTLDDIKAATAVRVAVVDPELSVTNIGGVAQLARTLGENLMGFTGKGAEKQPAQRPSVPGSRSDITVRLQGEAQPISVDGDEIIVDFPLLVRTRPGADLARWIITAVPRIVAEGGNSESVKSAEIAARVVGWQTDGGELHVGGATTGEVLASDGVALRVAHDRRIAVTASFSKERSE